MPKPVGAEKDQPQHYMFIASFVEWEPFTRSPEVVETLVGNGVWLVSAKMPFRRDYKKGDRALFYAAGKRARYFMADAVLAGPTVANTAKETALARKLGLEDYDERIPLEAPRLWAQEVSLKPLVADLEFIRDKKNWGLNLRQAAARISPEDFELILSKAEFKP